MMPEKNRIVELENGCFAAQVLVDDIWHWIDYAGDAAREIYDVTNIYICSTQSQAQSYIDKREQRHYELRTMEIKRVVSGEGVADG